MIDYQENTLCVSKPKSLLYTNLPEDMINYSTSSLFYVAQKQTFAMAEFGGKYLN